MQPSKKRVTVADIANSLGFSRNTVSRALNGQAGLTDETRSRILMKARELNYKSLGDSAAPPSPQTKKDILLICNAGQLDDSGFFFVLIQALLTEIRNHGATPIVQFNSHQDIEDEHVTQVAKKAAGIIAMDVLNPSYIARLLSFGKPVVFFDYHHQPDLTNQPCDIVISDVRPLRSIIHHMYQCGARSFGFAGDAEHCMGFNQRYECFRSATGELNACTDATLNVTLPEDVSKHPLADAYVCANDYIALPLIEALTAMGKRIPEDIQVCGFDGISHGTRIQPALTTVSVDPSALAANLAMLLFNRIANPQQAGRMLTLDSRITYRGTTAPQKEQG